MNRKLLLASTGAAVIAAAGFGSIALAQEDDSTPPSGGQSEGTADGPTGELDAVPDDTATGDGEEVFPSDGGTVFAECTADGPELVWWVAADGYTVDDVEAVPDDDRDDDDGDDNDAEVEFTSGTTDVDYDVTCADGQPQANITVEDDRDDDGSDDNGDGDWDDDDGRDDDDHHDDDGDDWDDD
ncbi:hypothetical protein [Glycomyces arizonensis]|uniref:hypothetical protein n=1 Tax=Glycomyces arizonensis TaxID=256035 RepID=UPI000687845D|nr:hypothetical protein [Glycomyces arizonensis]